MSRIERVEILQVDLTPKVVRTDAIQSFVAQETPIVRITCDDGATGTGYSYTIGTGGSSVVALLVVFGLGVDALIHFLNRLRLEEQAGDEPEAAIRRARVLVGPAIILTTIVLAFGLGVTVFSDLPSLRTFGLVCGVTLIASLVADLVFLPATILVYRRYISRHH